MTSLLPFLLLSSRPKVMELTEPDSESTTPACNKLGIKFSSKHEFLTTLKNVTPEMMTNQVSGI